MSELRFTDCGGFCCDLVVSKGIYSRKCSFLCCECKSTAPVAATGIIHESCCGGTLSYNLLPNLESFCCDCGCGSVLCCSNEEDFDKLHLELIQAQNTGGKGDDQRVFAAPQCGGRFEFEAKSKDGVVTYNQTECCGLCETKGLVPMPMMQVQTDSYGCGPMLSVTGGGAGFWTGNASEFAFAELKTQLLKVLDNAKQTASELRIAVCCGTALCGDLLVAEGLYQRKCSFLCCESTSFMPVTASALQYGSCCFGALDTTYASALGTLLCCVGEETFDQMHAELVNAQNTVGKGSDVCLVRYKEGCEDFTEVKSKDGVLILRKEQGIWGKLKLLIPMPLMNVQTLGFCCGEPQIWIQGGGEHVWPESSKHAVDELRAQLFEVLGTADHSQL